MLILTGQRREEMAGLCWSEFDAQTGVITLPPARTKNKRPHDLPLSNAALTILNSHQAIAGREYVFGEGKTGFQGWSKAKAAPSWREGIVTLRNSGRSETVLAQYVHPIIGNLDVANIDTADVLRVLEQPVAAERGWPAGRLWDVARVPELMAKLAVHQGSALIGVLVNPNYPDADARHPSNRAAKAYHIIFRERASVHRRPYGARHVSRRGQDTERIQGGHGTTTRSSAEFRPKR